ncbi:MAG TPA: hypothetical protein VHT30_11010 [Acidimicrobiales bacterium]|nr:hypothetical protein [Acidimicrobiales bacterium]
MAEALVLVASSRMALQLAVPGAVAAHTGTGVQLTPAGECAGTGAGEPAALVDEAPEAEPDDAEPDDAEPAAEPDEDPAAAAAAAGAVALATADEALRAAVAGVAFTAAGPEKAPTSTSAEPVARHEKIRPRTAPRREEGKPPTVLVSLNRGRGARAVRGKNEDASQLRHGLHRS